ncbi:unnamed protein product [Paramecium sonneborni]|uniref:Uncharacterized protein n=1 Tax=Paramecium sonneborni TaxID=65129 RepID=A0A8S1JVL1_9CILI|nr:unnamed protein product [Paramecium sonneborni]
MFKNYQYIFKFAIQSLTKQDFYELTIAVEFRNDSNLLEQLISVFDEDFNKKFDYKQINYRFINFKVRLYKRKINRNIVISYNIF